jgi:aryl-alcohol dehydrogenase-like predicted oxidoreductase
MVQKPRSARRKFGESVTNNPLGSTGMQVSKIGIGAAEIGVENASDQIVHALLDAAMDVGINVIDTAAMYEGSEEKLGRALRGRRNNFLLFTKCGRFFRPNGGEAFVLRARERLRRAVRLTSRQESQELLEWHPTTLKANIDASLRRLGTDHIDLMQLHSCTEETLRRGDAIEVLRRAQEAGKVLHIGYSGDGEAARYAITSSHFESVQISVNIADQEALDIAVPLAIERGLGVIAKRPVANGSWAMTGPSVYAERLKALGNDLLPNGRAYEIALRFTLSTSVHTAIVGTTNPMHLCQNAQYTQPLAALDFDKIRARWRCISRPDWVGQT